MNSPEATPFRFEISYDPGEVNKLFFASSPRGAFDGDRILIGVGLTGVACLFWVYMIALGAALLAGGTLAWWMRERIRDFSRSSEQAYLPSVAVHVTVTEAGYSIRGDDFSADTSWSHLTSSSERNGLLTLQSRQFPRVLLSVDQMKRAGVYVAITAIANAKRAERLAALSKNRSSTAP